MQVLGICVGIVVVFASFGDVALCCFVVVLVVHAVFVVHVKVHCDCTCLRT